MATTDITNGLLTLRYGLGGSTASIGITIASEITLFFVSRPFAEKFLSCFGNTSAPTVCLRCCGLSSLPSYDMRRPIGEKFRAFTANLDDLMVTREFFVGVSDNISLSPNRYLDTVQLPHDEILQ